MSKSEEFCGAVLKNCNDYCKNIAGQTENGILIGYSCLENVMELDDALIKQPNPPKMSSSFGYLIHLLFEYEYHEYFLIFIFKENWLFYSLNTYTNMQINTLLIQYQEHICTSEGFVHSSQRRALWRDCACFN